MNRFYVTTKEIWGGKHRFAAGHVLPRYNLFHKDRGSHYIDLADGLILVAADFHSAESQNAWHRQFQVARLADPQRESAVPLGTLLTPAYAHKNYRQYHHDALTKALGLGDHHTVLDVSAAAKRIHPACSLDVSY